jgi:hypothetical protein
LQDTQKYYRQKQYHHTLSLDIHRDQTRIQSESHKKMALSSPLSESYTIPRKAASAATNLIRDIQNEENLNSSVNKSKDDAAPAAPAAPAAAPPAVDAVKTKKGSRNKEVATTAQTVVTVGADEHPQSFLKIIRKHFLEYITTDEEALRLLIIHEVLDEILREHSIQSGNELLSADNMCSTPEVLGWLVLQFQASSASPAAEDVICGPSRPNRTRSSTPFIKIVKQNIHRGREGWLEIAELVLEKGLRFLLYMEPGIHFVLDKRDDEVKKRIHQALKNHKRGNSSEKGTKGTSATDTALASTSLASDANIASARVQRKDRPRSYEDSDEDEETASPLSSVADISTARAKREGGPHSYEDSEEEAEQPHSSKRPKIEHNPDLSDIKIGSKIAVYWAGDQCYYGGEITKYRSGENGERTSFCLDYDDGQEEWIGMCVHVVVYVCCAYESLDSIVITYNHIFVLFSDLRRHPFMLQSHRDDDSESLSSSTRSSPFTYRTAPHDLEIKNAVVSCSGGEGNTNLVIKFCGDKEDLSNLAAYKSVGFIIDLSLQSTFVALREAIDQNNLEGLPPDGNWKFYIPNLAVMSSGQESIFTVCSFPNTRNDNPLVIYVCLP